jgi:hypothetical protein
MLRRSTFPPHYLRCAYIFQSYILVSYVEKEYISTSLFEVCLYISKLFAHECRFKRLTGRNEVAVSARDYKFYSPRHKYRRVASNLVSNIPCLPVSVIFLYLSNKGVILDVYLKL